MKDKSYKYVRTKCEEKYWNLREIKWRMEESTRLGASVYSEIVNVFNNGLHM